MEDLLTITLRSSNRITILFSEVEEAREALRKAAADRHVAQHLGTHHAITKLVEDKDE